LFTLQKHFRKKKKRLPPLSIPLWPWWCGGIGCSHSRRAVVFLSHGVLSMCDCHFTAPQ